MNTQADTIQIPPALISLVAEECGRPVGRDGEILADAIAAEFGSSLAALVLYGSCLRAGDFTDGVVDLYALVDDYRLAGTRPLERLLNRLLPPGVYYREIAAGEHIIRVKLAVISLADFQQGAGRWFHSYIYARFAQPVRIIQARDDVIRGDLHRVLGSCIVRFVGAALAAASGDVIGLEALWSGGFSLSYGAELRPEPPGRGHELVRRDRDYYAAVTDAALPALAGRLEAADDGFRCLLDVRQRRGLRRRWRFRSWQGTLLSILRWMKAPATFHGSVDYAAWKIERHTGVRIEVTPALRRFPVLLGWRLVWQLLRRGALR